MDYSFCSKTSMMVDYLVIIILFGTSSVWIQHELSYSSIGLFCTCIEIPLMRSTNEAKSRINTPKDVVSNSTQQLKASTTEYFPWNDRVNYNSICKSIQKKLNSFKGPPIIHKGDGGGLGHKYMSLLHSFTTALIVQRPLSCIMIC